MIAVLRVMLLAVLGRHRFRNDFLPRAKHRALDPDEPIAADGSMTAGRARTIYDTNPLLGAFGEKPRPDPDDPKNFAVADRERSMDRRSRTRRDCRRWSGRSMARSARPLRIQG